MRSGAPLALAIAVLHAQPLAAQQKGPITGIELFAICSMTDADMRMSCSAYLEGFIDGLALGRQLAGAHVLSCPQAGVAAPQLSLMLQKAAHEHPELLHQNANVIVAQMLLEAWRCNPGEQPTYGK